MLPTRAEAEKIDEQNTARVRAVLDGYGDQLTEGAAEHLAGVWKADGNLAGPALAEKISRNLALSGYERYRNPEHSAATLENGQPASPLRTVLARHALALRDGAVDELTGRWQGEIGHLDEHALAAEVTRRLASRDVAEKHARVAPAAPEGEAKVRDVISRHFGEVNI